MTHRSPVVWLAILILALSFTAATADYYDGNNLLAFVKSKDPRTTGVLWGYVAGVQDSYNGDLFCVDPPVKLSQTTAVVTRYLKALDPKDWHLSGKGIVIDALAEAFPCKE